jgi:hypothetical protein
LKIVSGVATEVAIMVISPAQGAMFAPLALKLVKQLIYYFMTDWRPSRRAPVLDNKCHWAGGEEVDITHGKSEHWLQL